MSKGERFNQQTQIWKNKKDELLKMKRGIQGNLTEKSGIDESILEKIWQVKLGNWKPLVGFIKLNEKADLERIFEGIHSLFQD